jgi:hypothetical protein
LISTYPELKKLAKDTVALLSIESTVMKETDSDKVNWCRHSECELHDTMDCADLVGVNSVFDSGVDLGITRLVDLNKTKNLGLLKRHNGMKTI